MVIGDSHGGAIENAARIMQEWAKKDGDVDKIASDLVTYMKEKKIRMPGFGHRLHNFLKSPERIISRAGI